MELDNIELSINVNSFMELIDDVTNMIQIGDEEYKVVILKMINSYNKYNFKKLIEENSIVLHTVNKQFVDMLNIIYKRYKIESYIPDDNLKKLIDYIFKTVDGMSV